MRYNQMFATRVSVTIPGNFSTCRTLVFFDGPSLRRHKERQVDNDMGTIHSKSMSLRSPERTLTKLSLIRDSLEELVIHQGNYTWKAWKSISKG